MYEYQNWRILSILHFITLSGQVEVHVSISPTKVEMGDDVRITCKVRTACASH